MTARAATGGVFDAHAELLRLFLARRRTIVARIESILNARNKPVQYLHNRVQLSRLFLDCFFERSGLSDEQVQLRGQLEAAHWAHGFRPRQVTSLHNDLIDPAEMMIRGFYCWHQTRWPGRNGRESYAQTLFDVFLLRSLALLAMRLWDEGPDGVGNRLAVLQGLLDEQAATAPVGQPAMLRDARWLVPLALSPTTDELGGYFDVIRNVSDALPVDDCRETLRAYVAMIGGHLRSQIRHYALKENVSFDDASVVRRTRTSNALDFALLIQGLVPLLEAYEQTLNAGRESARVVIASAILQGISPDPGLFLSRIDLLGPYSMIEGLFIGPSDSGAVGYTDSGERHVRLLRDYELRIDRLIDELRADSPRFVPTPSGYSPYGAIFGTPSNLAEHIALRTLQRGAVTDFSLEDVFDDGGADRLAWVNGWRDLPHIDAEVRKTHGYPQRFAEDIFESVEEALRQRAAGQDAPVTPSGSLLVHVGDDFDAPAIPLRHVVASDPDIVATGRATPHDEAQLLRDREEGYYAVSFETANGWVAISKNLFTDELAAGRDMSIAALPAAAAATLRLMSPGIDVQIVDRAVQV